MKKINLTQEQYKQILDGNCWVIADYELNEGDAITIADETVAFITKTKQITMYVKHLEFFDFKPTNIVNLEQKGTYDREYTRIDEVAKVKDVVFDNLLKITGDK